MTTRLEHGVEAPPDPEREPDWPPDEPRSPPEPGQEPPWPPEPRPEPPSPDVGQTGPTTVAERWVTPFPYGYPGAAESVGSIASPLLAGFSFALVGLVVPTPEHFRWPNAALAVLFVAGALFIASVQCWFWARQYEITPEDINLWIPEYPQGRQQALQRLHSIAFYRWNGRMNRAYRFAILFLLVGVMLALLPPGHVSWLRSVAVALAALASLAEATWIAAIWFLHGSPSMAYDDQPDVPRDDVRFLELRRYAPLRRLARLLVPLPRIRLTDEERSS